MPSYGGNKCLTSHWNILSVVCKASCEDFGIDGYINMLDRVQLSIWNVQRTKAGLRVVILSCVQVSEYTGKRWQHGNAGGKGGRETHIGLSELASQK